MVIKQSPLYNEIINRTEKETLLCKAWTNYDEFLFKQPNSIRSIVHGVISRRKIKEQFTAGLHFPLWFSEAFSDHLYIDLHRLILGNLYLYLYVVIKDDQFDEHIHSSLEVDIAADLHLAESLKIFQHLCGEKGFFMNEFEQMRKAWFRHDKILIQQYKSTGCYVPDVESYAKKCAILKASGLVLASLNRNYGKWEKMSRAYDFTAIANTFVDDLTDWKEDVRSNHRTYLVSLALQDNCLNSIQDLYSLPEEKMALLIYRSTAISNSLEYSLQAIAEAKKLFLSCGAYSWYCFVNDMESSIRYVLKEWQTIKDKGTTEILIFDSTIKSNFCST